MRLPAPVLLWEGDVESGHFRVVRVLVDDKPVLVLEKHTTPDIFGIPNWERINVPYQDAIQAAFFAITAPR